MRILSIGASSEDSIGYQVSEYFRARRGVHLVKCVSRSGGVGAKKDRCDITNPVDVALVCERFKPHVIIHAAGVLVPNSVTESNPTASLDFMHQLILAKSLGSYNVINVARETPSVKRVIFLGGREVSSSEEHAPYTIGNGAMWAAAQYAAKHYSDCFTTHYIDLPLVWGSTMAQQLDYKGSFRRRPQGAISMRKVSQTVYGVIRGAPYPNGWRIVLGEGWTK